MSGDVAEAQVLPRPPGGRPLPWPAPPHRGRRRGPRPRHRQRPREELHQVGTQPQGEGRRQGGGRDEGLQPLHHDEAGQPGVHARGQREDVHHRLHGHDQGSRGPAAGRGDPHREEGTYTIESNYTCLQGITWHRGFIPN